VLAEVMSWYHDDNMDACVRDPTQLRGLTFVSEKSVSEWTKD